MDLKYRLLQGLLLIGATAGCSDAGTSGTDIGPVPLLLRVSTPDTVFFAKGNKPGRYEEVWKACATGDGRTALAVPVYYPADGRPVYLRGFAPEGTPDADGMIAYRADGDCDILVTDEQSGSLTDMFWQEKKTFVFTHLLTQLRFRWSIDEKGMAHGWQLRRLVVDGAQQDATLSLADKTLLFDGESEPILMDEGFQALDTAWTEMPEVLMVQPAVSLRLTVALEDSVGNRRTYGPMPVVFDEENRLPAAGTSYLLSVRIRTEGTVGLSASVAEWKKGSNGIGRVD